MTTTYGNPAARAMTTASPATGRDGHHGGDCGCGEHCSCDPPESLQRNAFFPRKLMEVRHWKAEQRYHRSSRELVTRLGLGSGVLCGLNVVETGSGSVVITHGVGVDGHGRIVVVPRDVEVDPTRLTGRCGRAAGEPRDEGEVTVSLCYHECSTDLVAMPPEACDGEPACVPSMVREAYAVVVTDGATQRTVLPEDVCHAVLHGHALDEEQPDSDDEEHNHGGHADEEPEDNEPDNADPLDREARRLLLDELHPRGCGCDEASIPLAVVRFGGVEGRAVDTDVRTVIRSNRELLDLILCLADRVDGCCQDGAVAVPPRIAGLWPWPDSQGAGRDDFVESQRLELAFDRDLAEQGLDDPSGWLGIWLLAKRGATRLAVSRAAGALGHVTVPTGGDGAAYEVELKRTMVRKDTLVVVMARSAAGGPVRAAAIDQLTLDPDLAATGLSPEQRDKLWGLEPGVSESSFGSFAADAVTGPAPYLPTGNGTAGGELHLVLRPATEVAPPPRLLTVWPPGAAVWDGRVEGSDRGEWKRWLEAPRIELTVSRDLADEALSSPREWLRLWSMNPDGDFMYALTELGLGKGETTDLEDGSVRCAFPIQPPEYWSDHATYLVQLRSTGPVGPASPLGRDDPRVLLDADVSATTLDSQTLFRVWSGDTFPDGLPWGPPGPTVGKQLYDDTEGGVAHWALAIGRS